MLVGIGVNVGVGVNVEVGVNVGVAVGVWVVAVTVGVGVKVKVGVNVGVGVGVVLIQLIKLPVIYEILFNGFGESIELISIRFTLSKDSISGPYGIYVLAILADDVTP